LKQYIFGNREVKMVKKVKKGRPSKSKNLKETTPHKIEPTLTEEEIVRNTVIKAFAIDPEPIPETSKSNVEGAKREDKWFYCPVCKDCFLVNQRDSHKH